MVFEKMTVNNFLKKILEFCDYTIIAFYNFLPFNNLDFWYLKGKKYLCIHSTKETGCTKKCLWSTKSLGSEQSNIERSVNEVELKMLLSDYNRCLKDKKYSD